MIKHKKDLQIIIVAVVAVVVLSGIIFWYQENPKSNFLDFKLNPKPQNNTSVKTTAPAQNTTLSYEEALQIYKNQRFQFFINNSGSCAMSPYSANLLKGTRAMLDNRSNQQITVYLDGAPYNIKAYGFKIVTLTTSTTLPHTLKVDCNSGKNNGQIILQ